MTLGTRPIGDFIQLVDNRNSDGKITNLLGMNIKKEFMPSVANTSETDLGKYKIIQKGQFAYSPMQTGRDETIRIALYSQKESAIISPAYSVFEVIDETVILPEFIMMWFLRPESDRYGWFISDASVRTSLEWDRFCEIKIPVPSIDEQKKYVSIYNGIIKNQKCYENSLDDLKLICDTFMNKQIKQGKREKLGPYIKQTEERNSDSSNRNLLGISVNKIFIPSRANREDLNVSNCKIIKHNQFGYVTVTSRNGGKLSIALRNGGDGIISSTYIAFKVIDTSVLLPEYLYLWFCRSEFDRYARYHSWGSARETFDWDDMCNVELPIPPIEQQKSIVAIHHVLEKRKTLNNQLKQTIRPLCPILMQGAIKDMGV